MFRPTTAVVFIALSLASGTRATYQPTWESLDWLQTRFSISILTLLVLCIADSRPIPDWFDEAKFGIFIHWGIFSVPSWSTGGGAEWYVQRLLTGSDHNATRNFHYKTYGKGFSYDQFGPMFKAELWDPAQWAELFKTAGGKVCCSYLQAL